MSYVLEKGEVILLRDDNAYDASGKSVTLLLTNSNLIVISYDFRGNGRDDYYALSELRESNGAPNVLVGKDPAGKSRLELYFEHCQQFFSFKSRLSVRKWATEIEKAYKVRMKEIRKNERRTLKSSNLFAPVKEKIDTVKESLTQREQRVVSCKCPFCGAITKGHKGEEIKCLYCEYIFVIQ